MLPAPAAPFSAPELAELLRRDLILRPTDIGLIDDIYSFNEAIELLLKPVESPLEVLRNTAPLLPSLTPEQRLSLERLRLAEGSLFLDGTIAAFGDVDLGGPLTDLYLGGRRAGMVAYYPLFALPGMPGSEEAARSALPSLAMVTLYDDIHLLSEAGLQRSQPANPAADGRLPLLPGPLGE